MRHVDGSVLCNFHLKGTDQPDRQQAAGSEGQEGPVKVSTGCSALKVTR